MKFYSLFWLNGEEEVIKGDYFEDALSRNKLTPVNLRGLDFWLPGDVLPQYVYSKVDKFWYKKYPVNSEDLVIQLRNKVLELEKELEQIRSAFKNA